MTTVPGSVSPVFPPTATALREVEVPGPVPRYEVPGWRSTNGVIAGITARGKGPPPGFDLGLWTANPVGEVMSRWREFRGAERGFSGWVLGNQVHQARVAWHSGGSGWIQVEGVDGHATQTAGLLLLVTVADCIPVYLFDPGRRAIALLHCGWRGTAAGMLSRGIETLVEAAGSSGGDIIMHCGIGICGTCYEVGREVMTGLGLEGSGPGPWHVDLRAVLAEAAQRAGVKAVSTSQWCTRHDAPRFMSHRGSSGRDGRMVAYLGIPSVAGEAVAPD